LCAGLVRVVFSVCGRLLGWLWVWLGFLGVSCFRLGVLFLFVECLYGYMKSFRDKPARRKGFMYPVMGSWVILGSWRFL